MSVYLTVEDLNNKYKHDFVFDIYGKWTYYTIVGFSCEKCMCKLDVYIGKDYFKFGKELNFEHVTSIYNFEYAYDNILTCEEFIIKNIIE